MGDNKGPGWMEHWGESRLPFLDYGLVNMLVPLAPEWKLRNGWTKWIFRKALETYLPPEIIWRRDKQGFINPQSEWLKNELRQIIEHFFSSEMLLSRSVLIDQSAFHPPYRPSCLLPI